jgi:hypothetical protein
VAGLYTGLYSAAKQRSQVRSTKFLPTESDNAVRGGFAFHWNERQKVKVRPEFKRSLQKEKAGPRPAFPGSLV